MGLFKRRRYYFTDSSIASDTVIALVMGGVALVIEIAGIITSIATKGHVPDVFGMLLLCAILLGIVGEIFAWIGNGAQEGGVTGKRVSIILNILVLAIALWIILL